MDPQAIDQLLVNQRSIEPYELAFSIYLYVVLLISTLLTVAIYFMFFGHESKLSKELRCMFIHGTFTCFAFTVITCLWQVGNLDCLKLGFETR